MTQPYTTDNQPTPTTFIPTVSITIGDIADTDDLAQYNTTGDSSLITDYEIMNKYEEDGHTYMMPVASQGGFQGISCAFVQLAAKTKIWIADWTACNFKTCPDIPDPYSVSSRWVLLDVHLEDPKITVGADGATPLYRISGTYYYGCMNPGTNVFDDVVFGLPPWLQDSFTRTVPLSALKNGIMNLNQQGPQGFVVQGGN